MDGLQDLTEIRRAGMKPQLGVIVFVTPYPLWDGHLGLDDEGSVTIQIDPADDLSKADFRPVVGLKCVVLYREVEATQNAARKVCIALQTAGAKAVHGFSTRLGRAMEDKPPFFEFRKEAA